MLVLRRRNDKKTKLEPNYEGPFRVIKIEKPNLQIRELEPDGQPFTVHMDQCKPYFTNEEAEQDTETAENEKPKHKNGNKKLGDTKLEESDEEMLEGETIVACISEENALDQPTNKEEMEIPHQIEIRLDGTNFFAHLSTSNFPEASTISGNLIKNNWEIFEDEDKYVIMWIFGENFKLRISNECDKVLFGTGVREFLKNSGNLTMEDGKVFYYERFIDQQNRIFAQPITPDVWITLRDHNPARQTNSFNPFYETAEPQNLPSFSPFNRTFDSISHHTHIINSANLQQKMSRFDSLLTHSNRSTSKNSSPTPPAILISSDSDSEGESDEQQQQQKRDNKSEPRPYAPVLTPFSVDQVQVIHPDQVEMYKKDYRLAEIDRQIQLMIDAKAKIQAEEEEEEQIKERRARSEKAKNERKKKEKEQMKAKSEAKRKEAEEKAKEKAKAEKEEWKRALRRPATTPEEKARKEAENKARMEAEEAARKELEEEARKEAEEKAQKEAEEKAQKEAEEKAAKEADEKAQKEAEEKAKKDEEEKKKSEKQQQNVGKRAEEKGEETVIARGIKKRRLTEEEKEKKQNMEKMEEVLITFCFMCLINS
ncbi:hypothetical protein niasHT_008816 [Heterodera trifolii]|uniref:Uncharacterized protein n=1 Tax=Heterodera trifolii TaxID=157864 RepID=A0ABD2LSQ8_9BILA